MRAINSFTSTLSSRGWAFLVLAGGFVLAVPFFKAEPSTKVVQNKSPLINRNSTQSLPLQSVRPLETNGLALPTTSPQANETALPKPSTTSRPSIDIAGITEKRGTIEPFQEKVDSTSSAETPAIAGLADESKVEGLVGAVPIHPELPSWAKKPSLLDAVVASSANSNLLQPNSPGTALPEARKPSAFEAWTQPSSETFSRATATTTDRYSPLRASNGDPLEQRLPARTQVRWPDEDPRTAVSQTPPPRLVGRDAMIRDPDRTQSTLEQLGRTVVHPGGESAPPSFNPDNLVEQPKFGQSPRATRSGSKAPAGAALRSKLPPDENLFISQPAIGH